MNFQSVRDDLLRIKEENGLEDIALFDREGNALVTTQDGEFTADETFYSLLAGAVAMISKSYGQESKGVTVELENSEFFMQYALNDGDIPEDGPIIAFEYEPLSKERDERKAIIDQISEVVVE